MFRRSLLALSSVFCAGGLLPRGIIRADTVHLKGGGIIQNCRVVKEDPKVKDHEKLVFIRTPGGRMGVPKELVARIDRGKSVFDLYDEKLAKIRDDDGRGLFMLALWCQETAGLRQEMDELLKKTIALKPDDAEARHLLGYIKDGLEWKKLPPLKLVLRIDGKKTSTELQEAIRRQLTVAFMVREDVRLEKTTESINPDDLLELETQVALGKTPAAIFYGMAIRGPAVHCVVSFRAEGKGVDEKNPPSLVLKGEVMASVPNSEVQAVTDGLTRGAQRLHQFLDQLLQLRVKRLEAAAASEGAKKNA